jgi:arginine utilization regulatory protein
MSLLKKMERSELIVITLNDENIIVDATKGLKKLVENSSFINNRFENVFDIKIDEISRNGKILDIRNKKYLVLVLGSNKKYEKNKQVILKEISIVEENEKKIYCYEEIFSKLNDGLIMSNEEGRITLYNEAQEKFEDLSKLESEGKFLWEVYNYNINEPSEHREVFKTGKAIIDHYNKHMRGTDSTRYLAYSTYPIVKDEETIAVFSVSKNESRLLDLLSDTIELKRQIKGNNEQSYHGNGTFYTFNDIKGNSDTITKTIKEAASRSLLSGNLLIIGETGVGKEMFAQSMHNISTNKNEKFFAVNCAALPENLLESTLFGTTKGSFTGSVEQTGYFDEVGKGTLFLDELNSMPIHMQTKLLRVLQEKRFRKVGGLKSKNVECRIMCAINEGPEKLINEGRLR